MCWASALVPQANEQAVIPNGGTAIVDSAAPDNPDPAVTHWFSDLYFSPNDYGTVHVVSGGTLCSKMLNISTGGMISNPKEGRLLIDGGQVFLADERKWMGHIDGRQCRAVLDVINGGHLHFGSNHFVTHNGRVTVSNATLHGDSWIELGTGGTTGVLEICNSSVSLSGLTLGRYTGSETSYGIGGGNGKAATGLASMYSGTLSLAPANPYNAMYVGWKTPVNGSVDTLGRFSLFGGDVITTNCTIIIGVQNRTTGEFLMSGGSLTTRLLLLGREAGARGMFSMTGGTLSLLEAVQGAGGADVRLAGGRIVPIADRRKLVWGVETTLPDGPEYPSDSAVRFDAASDQFSILVTNRVNGERELIKTGSGKLIFQEPASLDRAGVITVSNGMVHVLSGVAVSNTAFRVLNGGTLALEESAVSGLSVSVENGGTLLLRPSLFATAVTGLLSNKGFETPSVATYTDNPINSGWAFSASGVQRNGSTSGEVKHYTWDGDQTAFMRANAVIAQTFTVPENGEYLIAAMTAKQPYSDAVPVNLKIDGAVVAAWTPTGNFVYVYSEPVSLEACDVQNVPITHTIQFESGSTPALGFSVIDDVRVFRLTGQKKEMDMRLSVETGATVDIQGGGVANIVEVYVDGVLTKGRFGMSHPSQIFTGSGVLRSVLPGTMFSIQ